MGALEDLNFNGLLFIANIHCFIIRSIASTYSALCSGGWQDYKLVIVVSNHYTVKDRLREKSDGVIDLENLLGSTF